MQEKVVCGPLPLLTISWACILPYVRRVISLPRGHPLPPNWMQNRMLDVPVREMIFRSEVPTRAVEVFRIVQGDDKDYLCCREFTDDVMVLTRALSDS